MFVEPDGDGVVATISLDHCYSAVEGNARNVNSAMSSEIDSSDSTTPLPVGSSRCLSPKRRSQRQIDKIEMEQLRKIRAENEELLKKEKEVMNLRPVGKVEETPPADPVVPQDAPTTDAADAAAIPAVAAVPAIPSVAAVAAAAAAGETPKAPLSRLQTIRQEMQQKILIAEPVGRPSKPQTDSQTKSIPPPPPPEKSAVTKTPPATAQVNPTHLIQLKIQLIISARTRLFITELFITVESCLQANVVRALVTMFGFLAESDR